MNDAGPAPSGGGAPAFGRLVDLAPREAWGHEAHAFTPWLAENIDRLAEAVGMELELTGQEVRVERFAADILARDPSDDSVVLIENQLEATDHTHLGQILTYLAGLDARAVIWISPEFREPHLSAVRWLNEHTAEGFSFFAVRLRVVQIGESPMAPVFEVVEKPNGWERRLSLESQRGGNAERTLRQRDFWQLVAERDLAKRFRVISGSYHHTALPARVRIVSQIGDGTYVGSRTYVENVPRIGVTLREGGALEVLQRAPELAARLEAEAKDGRLTLAKNGPGSLADSGTWPKAADWLIEARDDYLRELSPILAETST